MRHFDHLDPADRERLFLLSPEALSGCTDRTMLALGLGATLYSPATRPTLAEDIRRQRARGVTSMVLCLEDSIADDDVEAGERNLVEQLRKLDGADVPLLFVRVRAPEQIGALVAALGDAVHIVTGFVLPKFGVDNGAAYLDAVRQAGGSVGRRLLAMPVMETAAIAAAETRVATLVALRVLLDEARDDVLAIRVGATDLGSGYGLRRLREHTVYDVGLLAGVIGDVVNVFGCAEGGYVVTGPVWEYFSAGQRLFKPQLRESPFLALHERRLRAELLARDLDGLIREVSLDRANGLSGKSVIHPSHIAPVHALSVVTHEEHVDALDILGTAGSGGASSSAFGNKMNESKPHTAWARRTELRARVFGVAAEGVSYVDVLAASLQA